MPKEHQGTLGESLLDLATDLADAGLLNKHTMKDFYDLALTPLQPLTPGQIKKLREKQRASQTVFARYLNVTPSLVSQWERGEKEPCGPSLKLLNLVAKNGLRSIA